MSVVKGLSGALPGARREAAEFADLLEGGRAATGSDLAPLVALTRALAPASHAPRAEFRAALRDRLVVEAASRAAVPAPRAAAPVPTPPQVAPRRPRLRHAVATLALASVVTGAGAATASTRALPGDALYGLKRQIENVQLALAGSDFERGRELLEQADARLGEAEALAASATAGEPQTRTALEVALGEMERATDRGAVALVDAYGATGDTEPMLLLDRFVVDQQERLQDLLLVLDPSLRARVLAHVDELARTASHVRTLLDPSATAVSGTKTGAPGGSAGRAPGDGWAVSRLGDRRVAAATGGGSAISSATTAGGPGAGGSTGDLLGDTLAGVTGGSSSGGGSAGGGDSGPGGGASEPDTSPLPKVSVPATGPVTTPLPVDPTSPAPLPSVPAVPSLPPTGVVTTPAAPLPIAPCVPVPPLTGC